ncbi:hypothetical protein NL676_016901 [Syzygium grande]|nr:hypothetical protein NL676_016901 [Syzygium grande]
MALQLCPSRAADAERAVVAHGPGSGSSARVFNSARPWPPEPNEPAAMALDLEVRPALSNGRDEPTMQRIVGSGGVKEKVMLMRELTREMVMAIEWNHRGKRYGDGPAASSSRIEDGAPRWGRRNASAASSTSQNLASKAMDGATGSTPGRRMKKRELGSHGWGKSKTGGDDDVTDAIPVLPRTRCRFRSAPPLRPASPSPPLLLLPRDFLSPSLSLRSSSSLHPLLLFRPPLTSLSSSCLLCCSVSRPREDADVDPIKEGSAGSGSGSGCGSTLSLDSAGSKQCSPSKTGGVSPEDFQAHQLRIIAVAARFHEFKLQLQVITSSSSEGSSAQSLGVQSFKKKREEAHCEVLSRKRPGSMPMRRRADAILTFLSEGCASEVHIRQVIGDSPDTSKALRMLLKLDEVKRSGTGGRHDPYIYEVTQREYQKGIAG